MTSLLMASIAAMVCAVVAAACAWSVPQMSEERSGLLAYAGIKERVMAQKEAVITMGMTKTHYIEQLQGVGHLSVRRLGLLGDDFWLALIDELRTHFHLDNDEQQLTRAFDGMRACLSVIERVARKGLR